MTDSPNECKHHNQSRVPTFSDPSDHPQPAYQHVRATEDPHVPTNCGTRGKQRSGKARKDNAVLRSALCEAAWSAAKTRDTYLAAQFKRFSRRFGKRNESKAIFAVAHTMRVGIWWMLTNNVDYQELGSDYFEQRTDQTAQTRRLVRQLERLGHQVSLTPAA